nr:poly(A)-specific ribonuclease PARN-like isoform X2 [Megalopta genalis]
MEVTRSNFQEVLSELDDVIKNASFLAIDGEFTGLNSGPDAGAFDIPAQYYTKLRAGSMDFLLIQVGLSVFTFDKHTNKYSQRSYNFYVFPRPLNHTAPDSRFMCQASCIAFLSAQDFDFNKLFKLGIPYLTTSEEEVLVKRLEERQKAREEVPELIPIAEKDKPQITEICSRIEKFIASDAEQMTIEKCNAYIRKLVHQEVRVRWPNKLRVESKIDYLGHSLVVQRSGTKKEEEQKDAERREREKMEIKEAVGLSSLLRKIADSGKLIVGHNMLLDICHIVHKFFGQLPESYLEFKSLVHSLFPRILDTKVLCESPEFKENVPLSNLNVLLERVSKAPFEIPEIESIEGRSYSTSVEKCHEAGYDAYITGVCFIALCNYLGRLQKPEVPIVLADSPLLNPFLNKLLIARLKDYPYISLVDKDPNPSRDHVFHLTFPKEWKINDIIQLFSPFGGVYVSWLSDTSAYVALNRREQVISATKCLFKKKHTPYKIQKYVDHQASFDVNNDRGERKRKLSSIEPLEKKPEEISSPASGRNLTDADDGWEVAKGKRRQKRKDPADGDSGRSAKKKPFSEASWD